MRNEQGPAGRAPSVCYYHLMNTTSKILLGLAIVVAAGVFLSMYGVPPKSSKELFANISTMKDKLPPDVFHVMYEKGTERPFSSSLYNEKRSGTYVSADTGLPLFRSEDKFESGTGWPSFTKPIDGAVVLKPDNSLFMRRTEVVSADTGAHLGHVFDDGPADRGGKRYCINGLALRFIPDGEEGASERE